MSHKYLRLDFLKILRIILIVIGAAALLFAWLADWLGYGQPGSFGIGQFLLALTGIFVILIAVLGRKVGNFYRSLAVILLNTLILMGCLELGAIIFSRFFQRVESANIRELPYYKNQKWTEVYWQEALASENYQYKPYVIWGHLPFAGKLVNYNQEGFRETPGAECVENAYRVFTFGGSTMMGWGSPDWGTIPAYLQGDLEEIIQGPVCVENFAEDGYVSTQSLLSLILQLQSGNLPDMVIFYDGVNEVLAAYESGQPTTHVSFERIAAKFDEREHPLIKWIKSSRVYSIIEDRFLKSIHYQNNTEASSSGLALDQSRVEKSSLSDLVARVYVNNYRIVGVLAQEYGFDYFFFWQPQIAVGKKKLTPEEYAMKIRMDSRWVNLAGAIDQNIESVEHEHEKIVYLGNIFDEHDEQIWIDEAGHVTPEGNLLIAMQ
jgi:hypothetical protein